MNSRRFLCLLVMLCPFLGWSGTITVCQSCSVKTLSQAVDQAKSGDTIRVKADTYKTVNLEIKKRITIIGEKGAILDGNMEGYVLKLMADSIAISGFTIKKSGRSYTKDFAAIYAFKANYLSISNMTLIDPFFGMLIEKSKHGRIFNNTIFGHLARMDDSGNGIHLWHCSGMQIADNEVYKMRDGIYLEFVDESTIKNNYTHNNVRYGLHFMFSNHDNYLNNTFEHNGAGVAVMFSKFIVMRKNRFIENWGTASYGLLLKEIYDAEVEQNEFMDNTIGIFIEGSTRINYQKNVFSSNGWAIKVSGGCYANRFFKNDFLGNSFDVSYNSKMNDNSFEGNYWSEYVGYDLDKDGIGDVPYRPVKLFSYIVNNTPETIVLLRSLFVDIINFSEKVSPVFTPNELIDDSPLMKSIR
jgi:nitrous oxidase accessory protein